MSSNKSDDYTLSKKNHYHPYYKHQHNYHRQYNQDKYGKYHNSSHSSHKKYNHHRDNNDNKDNKESAPELLELKKYYQEVQARKKQAKLAEEECERSRVRAMRKQFHSGIERIFQLFPQGADLINFIKDAIDNDITRVKLCDVSCVESGRYKQLLDDAIVYIKNQMSIPINLYASERETGGNGYYSYSLIWDWTDTFPCVLDSPSHEDTHEETFSSYEFVVANKKFLDKHNMQCLNTDDLKQFVEYASEEDSEPQHQQ